MKTAFHRLKTSDGLELDGLLYEPDTKTEKVLVHIHGMAGNFYENKFLDNLSKTLTDNGVALALFNNRGAEFFKDLRRYTADGVTHIRIGSAYERFAECLFDVSACIDFAAENGFSEIHLSGHSLGGPKIVYYMYKKKDDRIKSVLLLSPADMIGLAMEDAPQYGKDIKMATEMVKSDKGKELLPGLIWEEYPLSADTYLDLSEEGSDVGVLNFYDSNDKLEAISSIDKPIIAIMGRKDDASSVPVEDMMERIKQHALSSPKVETEILGDADHGYNGYEQKLADVVLGWLKGSNV